MTTPTNYPTSYDWCWTCDRNVGQDRYLHRADNPVTRHERCSVCNDVLLSKPRPADKPTGEAALLARGYRTPEQAAEEWAQIRAKLAGRMGPRA